MNQTDLLLFSDVDGLFINRIGREAGNLERGEMLSGIRCLFQRQSSFPFHQESIKILRQQHEHSLGQRPDDAKIDILHHIQNSERLVLKDWIRV